MVYQGRYDPVSNQIPATCLVRLFEVFNNKNAKPLMYYGREVKGGRHYVIVVLQSNHKPTHCVVVGNWLVGCIIFCLGVNGTE